MQMTTGLTSTETLSEVQKLFDKWFDLNSLLDRQVYLIDIKFNMVSFQNFWHECISHLAPLLADKLQEFGSMRNDTFYRGIVPEHKEQYDSLLSAIEDYVMYISEIENMCKNIILTAIDKGDLMYEDFVRDYEIKYVAPLMKQGIIFYNAIKQYIELKDINKWNKDYSSFIIPEIKNILNEFGLKEDN